MTFTFLDKLNPINWIKELIKLPLEYCIAFATLFFIMLYSNKFNKFIGIDLWTNQDQNRAIIGLMFLIFTVLVFGKIIERVKFQNKLQKSKGLILASLDSLCKEELDLLLKAVSQGQNTLWLDITNNSLAVSLCNKGLLKMSAGAITVDSYDRWPHVITDFVYKELNKRYQRGYFNNMSYST